MKLAVCLVLASITVSASAFGVLPQPSRAAASTHRTSYEQPKPSSVVLFEKEDDDEDDEDPLLNDVVEDDEWMKLTIQLTDALYGEVKRVVDRVVDEEDKQKIEKAGKEVEVYVKAEVEKIRSDSKADLKKFTDDLTNKIETEVRTVSGDANFSLDEYKKEAKARIMTAMTDFAVGKATIEGLKEEIANRVDDRVRDAKDAAGYEFWKFKKALEREQDRDLKKVLALKEEGFFNKLFSFLQ